MSGTTASPAATARDLAPNGLTAQDLAEIRNTLAAFVHVFDNADLDRLDRVFTEDAVIELTRGTGSLKRGLAEIRAFTASIAPHSLDHHSLDTHVFVDGDGAVRARSRYLAVLADQSVHNGDFLDELVRTPAGWRISLRISVPRFPRGDQVPPTSRPAGAWRIG